MSRRSSMRSEFDDVMPEVQVLKSVVDEFISDNGASIAKEVKDLVRRRGKAVYCEQNHRLADTYLNFIFTSQQVQSYLDEAGVTESLDRASNRVAVTSLGAGVAPEIYALAALMRKNGIRKRLTGTLFDKEPNWSTLFDALTRHSRRHVSLEGVRYHRDSVDVTWIGDEWLYHIRNADLVLMTFVVTELMMDDDAQYSLATLFNSLKPGATLFILDEARPQLGDYLIDLADDCGLFWTFWFDNRKKSWEDQISLSSGDDVHLENMAGCMGGEKVRTKGHLSAFSFQKL